MKPAALQDLYHRTVLEHAVNPRGFGDELESTHQASRDNLVCGDHVQIQLRVENGRIRQAAFNGESCAICTASASLLCAQGEGSDVADFHEIAQNLLQSLDPDPSGSTVQLHENLVPLTGVLRFPARINCARLPWQAALDAITGNARDN